MVAELDCGGWGRGALFGDILCNEAVLLAAGGSAVGKGGDGIGDGGGFVFFSP